MTLIENRPPSPRLQRAADLAKVTVDEFLLLPGSATAYWFRKVDAAPVVYRCVNEGPRAHFYREVAPGRWETAMGPYFEFPVRIQETDRAGIEAYGHRLVEFNPAGGAQ